MINAAMAGAHRREAVEVFGDAGGGAFGATLGRQHTTRSRTDAPHAAVRKPVRESGQDREVERACGDLTDRQRGAPGSLCCIERAGDGSTDERMQSDTSS